MIPPPSASWTLGGSATFDSSGDLQLTEGQGGAAGSAYWPTPITAASLTATFDETISGSGNTADGFAFDLLDATLAGAAGPSTGDSGAALGFGFSNRGRAVAFVENAAPWSCYPSDHFIGVADGTENTTCPTLNYLTTASPIPALVGSTHHVSVTVTFGSQPFISVTLDGAQEISYPDTDASTPFPSSVYVGFSGGSGIGTETDTISNVSISYTLQGEPSPTPPSPTPTPSTPAHYRLELKAWIPFAQIVDPEQPFSGAFLDIPPFGGVADSCFSPPFLDQFATEVVSTYHGDGHPGYAGSYRVLVAAEFDWDGHQITNWKGPGALGYPIYGTTKRLLDYFWPGHHHQCVADSATATQAVVATHTGNNFDLEIHSSNPLVHPAPDIDSVLNGYIAPDGSIHFDATTDEFPSHGFRVLRNGQELGTAILNDASCIGAKNVLGLSGAIKLFEGLTSQDSGFSGTIPIPPPGDSPFEEALTSPLCDLGGGSSDTSVYVGGEDANAAGMAAAGRSSVLVARSTNGATPSGGFMSLATAEQRHLIVYAAESSAC